jgi:hypothetical protein
MPYSLLGADERARPSKRTESMVFPMADREPGFQTSLRPARANCMRPHEHREER